MHGVSFPESDDGLELLVVIPLPQSSLQHQRLVWILIFHHLHVKVGWVPGLDVNLRGNFTGCFSDGAFDVCDGLIGVLLETAF